MRDDVQLGSASFGLALPVDPGTHAVVVSVPGRVDRRVVVTLKAGDAQTLVLKAGELDPNPARAAGSRRRGEPSSVGCVAHVAWGQERERSEANDRSRRRCGRPRRACGRCGHRCPRARQEVDRERSDALRPDDARLRSDRRGRGERRKDILRREHGGVHRWRCVGCGGGRPLPDRGLGEQEWRARRARDADVRGAGRVPRRWRALRDLGPSGRARRCGRGRASKVASRAPRVARMCRVSLVCAPSRTHSLGVRLRTEGPLAPMTARSGRGPHGEETRAERVPMAEQEEYRRRMVLLKITRLDHRARAGGRPAHGSWACSPTRFEASRAKAHAGGGIERERSIAAQIANGLREARARSAARALLERARVEAWVARLTLRETNRVRRARRATHLTLSDSPRECELSVAKRPARLSGTRSARSQARESP